MSDPNAQQPADAPAVPPVPPAPPSSAPAAPQQPAPAPGAYPPPAYQNPPAYQGAPAYQSPPAYQGAPAYNQPYGSAAPRTNTLAIVSLVSGIAAYVILPVIASIVAVITGHMSLKQLKTSGEAGRGMALTGTILGWVGIGLTVVGVIFIVFWFVVFGAAIASSGYDYS